MTIDIPLITARDWPMLLTMTIRLILFEDLLPMLILQPRYSRARHRLVSNVYRLFDVFHALAV